ncbi:deleted in malignant brain tumors 1 protein, partial [Lepisosteus oculatus]|uniref:deleted in malignant brain tumors 1 protein n=1 Tax=Lepisosteus oculatus TaxID=7918 RepID=UPI0037105675
LDEVTCRGSELYLWDCEHAALGQSDCRHKEDAGVSCAKPERIKLSGGPSACSGRVEVLYGGSWGTVCDDSWDLRDAQVVCRQLGCGEAVSAGTEASWGEGNGTVWLDEVTCRGSELHLWDCEHTALGQSDCQHRRRAGVRCADPPKPRPAPQAPGGQSSLWTVCIVLGALLFVAAALACGQRQRNRALQKEIAQWEMTSLPYQDALYEEINYKLYQQGKYIQRRKGSDLSGGLDYDDEADEDSKTPGYTDFRLASGPDRCSGRVEMKLGAQWGTVCDQGWDLRDATVLCQQLNCGYAEAVLGPARFGQGNGSTWTDVFDCEGTETELRHCPISPWAHSSCSHSRDVGVVCSGAAGGVRLVGGAGHCDGRVEVFSSGKWGRLLDSSWTDSAASVLCRQLGCGSALETSSSSRYGSGRSDVCFSGVSCSGNETHLGNCSRPQPVSCSSGSDVGVLCEKHGLLRLSGAESPCAGRLEVYHRGSWGTVCDDSWDLADSQVVCRQLQCGTAVRAPAPVSFSQGTGPIWLDEVGCLGNESSLWECPSRPWGQHDCGHKEDVTIVCSEFKQLRLVSEQFECAGRAEVFYNGTWGNICQNLMDSHTASLICRQLNCGDFIDFNTPDDGSGLKWLDDVQCKKHDVSLWQCPHSPWGENTCTERDVVGLICTGKREKPAPTTPRPCTEDPDQPHCPETERLRLMGGVSNCSGRVEVLYGGSWGTVCDDSWDLRDAQVVCRQLGCGEAVSAGTEASWGEGNGTVWLDEVTCRGSELYLWDCEHAALGQSDCRHKEDAGVSCAKPERIKLSGGPSACSGRVEVLYGGSWGTVCDDSWDLRDAQVVCRQLGCGEAVSAGTEASWGEGNGTVWLDEVTCRGSELHLWDCEHAALGQSDCQHRRRAGVRCADPPKPRPTSQAPEGQSSLWTVCIVLGVLLFVAAALACGQRQRNRALQKEIAQLEMTSLPHQDALYEEINYKLYQQGQYSQYRKGSDPSGGLDYDDVAGEDNETPGGVAQMNKS